MPRKSGSPVVWKPSVLTPSTSPKVVGKTKKVLPRASLQTLQVAVQEAAASTRPRQLLAPGSSSSQDEEIPDSRAVVQLTSLERYLSPVESAKTKPVRDMAAWLEEEISSGRWDLQWESDPAGRSLVVGKKEDGKGKGKAL